MSKKIQISAMGFGEQFNFSLESRFNYYYYYCLVVSWKFNCPIFPDEPPLLKGSAENDVAVTAQLMLL
jgi:hypothetical protein